LGKAVWAFPRSLQRQLFGAQEDELAFQRDVRRRLDPQQAEALIQVQDKPSRALHDLSKAINALPLDYLRRMHIDQSVVELVDALGACERIYSSPVPLVYTRHTARFVTSWMFLLPFALWEPFESTWNHLGMVPSSVVIAFFLFGIEELAVQLEEPFSILPLEEIVNRIDHCVSDYQTWNYQDDLDKQEPSFIGIDGSKIESERLH
jgi:predicted membrane chloride channel (bestrophin family)